VIGPPASLIPVAKPSPTLFRFCIIGAIVAGWLLAWFAPWKIIFKFPSCIFRLVTGLPCPFCGLTRSCVAAANGQIADAIIFNPLGPVLMAVSLVALAVIAALLVLKRPPLDLDTFYAKYRWFRPAVVGLWLLNWIFMIARTILR
jgi:hypothetical protein